MSDNPFSLEGKTILVTGASSGIGRAIAVASSRLGAQLILVGRDNHRLTETLNCLHGSNHSVYSCDITDSSLVGELIDQLPKLDGLVHSAGVGLTLPFRFISEKELKRVMDVNFTAPVLLTQRLLKSKHLNEGASIVYLASIDGVVTGHVGNSIYSASKGALVGMAKSQAVELASYRIRVNCISPGRVETPLIQRDNISEEQVAANKKLYPLKRYAQPEEIAYYAVYLLSDVSTFTTGSNLVIDGGFSLL